MRLLFIMLCLVSPAFAFDWRSDVNAVDFTDESHVDNDSNIRKENGHVTSIKNANWIQFDNFDFGTGVNYLWIEVATTTAGGTVEFFLDSFDGPLIGAATIVDTNGWFSFKPLGVNLTQPAIGVRSLYLRFVGGGGDLFNVRKFRFNRLAPDYKALGPLTSWESHVLSQRIHPVGSLTSESHPADQDNIRVQDGRIGYIKPNSWIAFSNFDFGINANFFSILAASGGSGGAVEIRLGSPDGTWVGSVPITPTGSWTNFIPFAADMTQVVSGVNDLYLKFTGSGNYMFDVESFRFQSVGSQPKSPGRVVSADQFDLESNPGAAPVVPIAGAIESLSNASWVAYQNFDFGQNTDLITLEAATPGKGGAVEIRIDSPSGPLLATVNVTHSGSFTHYRPYSAAFVQKLSGTHHLYLKFIDVHQVSGELFNLKSLVLGRRIPVSSAPSGEGTVHVYPPVPGLADSPYYSFSMQKVSALNAPLKQNATNWLNPFAWFTECVEPVAGKTTAYYEEFIGGWSHTYCNFEMDRNTSIVVKVSRKNLAGAPSGPIFMANAHPAHRIISCEVINGDVYVTMAEPALISIDIDGQLDTRDAPRALPDVWNAGTSPYKSKANGAHAVSIFANPFIADKPHPGDSGVRVILPGGPLPDPTDDSWTTLYFNPGIHNLSQNENGTERPWQTGDQVALRSGKNYYIPGDAVVYGNFDDRVGDNSADKMNIRFFGHGTLSGLKVPHWLDLTPQDGAVRMVSIHKGGNVHFEGITISDPAEFGIAIENFSGSRQIPQNSMRWIKSISWRVNNDVGQMSGGVVEDSFFRHQDDGFYVGDADIRRTVFWTDVNGTPFHCPNLSRDGVPQNYTTFPRNVVIDDCDVIYARGMFGFTNSKDFGVIGNHHLNESRTYSDGTTNTGQHVVFRNLRITDPRPVRSLFALNVDPSQTNFLGWAGIRFENIEYRHPQTWGWKNHLYGSAIGPIQMCYFDRVSIAGVPMNPSLLADINVFNTNELSDPIFSAPLSESPTTYNLLANSANGSIVLNPPGGVYASGTVVTASVVAQSGYRFQGWSGDLAGSVAPISLTMDGHKAITATFSPSTTNSTIDTTGGTTVLDYDTPQNTYIGNGTLQVSSDGSPERQIMLGTGEAISTTVFAMTGGLITIDDGVSLVNGGWGKGDWANNLADMQVNGTLDLWDGQAVRVNALHGAGAVAFGYPWGGGLRQIYVGVAGGSGTFSGSISGTHSYGGTSIQIVKNGTGTQTFNNLSNQKPLELTINHGAVDLFTANDVTFATNITGEGNLVKSGGGLLMLTGIMGHTGSTTINQGTLSVGTNLPTTASLIIAAGAVLKLDFTDSRTVKRLEIAGSSSLPPGTYSSSHGTYGAYFTGGGMLKIADSGYVTWGGWYEIAGGFAGDDSDGDGIANLLEYVIGGNPNLSSTDFLPKATTEGADLVLSYERSDASELDTIQVGQWSADLINWSAVDVVIELVSENGSASDDMKIRIPLEKSVGGKLYGRLYVEKP